MPTLRLSPDELPLFPREEQIADAVLGPGRLKDWLAYAPILERHGLPKKDPFFGSRHWPSVRRWFDTKNGMPSRDANLVADGRENWDD